MFTDAKQMIDGVKVYASWCAHEVDRGTHKTQGIKSTYDLLCQKALDLRLATAVVFLDSPLPHSLRTIAHVVGKRPHWYPANTVAKPKQDLLGLGKHAFESSWLKLRLLAEPPSARTTFWDSDPALVFDVSEKTTLCRMASVGHEGHIYFSSYPKERAWEQLLIGHGELSLVGSGEDAYRELLQEPGRIYG